MIQLLTNGSRTVEGTSVAICTDLICAKYCWGNTVAIFLVAGIRSYAVIWIMQAER